MRQLERLRFKTLYGKVTFDNFPQFWHQNNFRAEEIRENKLKRPKDTKQIVIVNYDQYEEQTLGAFVSIICAKSSLLDALRL